MDLVIRWQYMVDPEGGHINSVTKCNPVVDLTLTWKTNDSIGLPKDFLLQLVKKKLMKN